MSDTWWVDSREILEEALRELSASAAAGLDTEYDSFRYFREKLCLIQLTNEKHTYLVDPLAGFDLSGLGRLFADPAVVKVTHAGDNDLRILKRDYGFSFAGFFDTHRAASLLGDRQLSLSTLIGLHLGVQIDKKRSTQRSRWENRPLTAEQLRYAAEDTSFLVPLYRKLAADLRERNLEAEAQRLFEQMCAAEWHEKRFNPLGHLYVEGYETLMEDQRARLARLYRWRFAQAKRKNMAVFRVLSDPELIALCRSGETTPAGLVGSGALSAEKARRLGADIVPLMEELRETE
ncbi:MAG TPA: ribonuclease D [Syntrophales bacterium]|nr:ribonuclease D [Syntrophales bacterium]